FIICNIKNNFYNTLKNKGMDSLVTVCPTLSEAIEHLQLYSQIKQHQIHNTNKLNDVFGDLFEQKAPSNITFIKKDFDNTFNSHPGSIDLLSNINNQYTYIKEKELNNFNSLETRFDKLFKNNNKPDNGNGKSKNKTSGYSTVPFKTKQKPEINKKQITEDKKQNNNIKKKYKAKVLYVENNKNNCKRFKEIVAPQGYKVITFLNASDAIDYLKVNFADIIVSEITIPQISGIELCSLLKQSPIMNYFIFLSNKTDIKTKLAAFNSGADDYICKPFNSTELIARINVAEKQIKKLKKLKTENDRLEKLVLTDPLTNLGNKRFFDEQLTKEMNRAERYENNLALVILDIDHFKKINDTYGHVIGDKILKRVGNILLASTRDSDIVCRVGGEEFIVLLPETSKENAFAVAEKIRKVFEKTTFIFSNIKIHITISLGISMMTPDLIPDQIEFIDMADKALYIAKNEGRNKTIIYDTKKQFIKLLK
ncbi:MAG: diguanylate cyclase, partial [Vampirovibrionia bacterium]